MFQMATSEHGCFLRACFVGGDILLSPRVWQLRPRIIVGPNRATALSRSYFVLQARPVLDLCLGRAPLSLDEPPKLG